MISLAHILTVKFNAENANSVMQACLSNQGGIYSAKMLPVYFSRMLTFWSASFGYQCKKCGLNAKVCDVDSLIPCHHHREAQF
jgi:hypothetical protein